MNLDDLGAFRSLDTRNLMEQIRSMPDRLANAYQLGKDFPLAVPLGIRQAVVVGLGDTLAGADLLAGYGEDVLKTPVWVQHNATLPAWVSGPEVLVILLYHSGDDCELRECLKEAASRGVCLFVISGEGALAEEARAMGAQVWAFSHDHIPAAALPVFFALLHTLFFRLGWLSSPEGELPRTIHAMRNTQMVLQKEVPAALNPAKRMAGQLMGRWVILYAADYLIPVARRWKTQINEVALTSAQVETLPDAGYNTLAGMESPSGVLSSLMVLFLRAEDLSSRNTQCLDLAREMYLQQGINTDFIDARGESRLSHLWSMVLFGDYMAYYLAMAYGVDPSSAPAVAAFQSEMTRPAE